MENQSNPDNKEVSAEKMTPPIPIDKINDEKLQVPIVGYFALIMAVIFFSGVFTHCAKWPDFVFHLGDSEFRISWQWLSMFDFNLLSGQFGVIGDTVKSNFIGKGGTGIRNGFLFAISLIPTVMFALGIVEVVEYFGGLKAAQKLMNPILRPILGLPGKVGLALISSMQSTDAGAGMTKALRDNGDITEKEKTIFAAFQFTAGGTITNYISVGTSLFAFITLPILIPLLVLFFFKIFGANLMRAYLTFFVKDIDVCNNK